MSFRPTDEVSPTGALACGLKWWTGSDSMRGFDDTCEADVPIFEFQCLKCEREFEKLVLGSWAADKIACPKCGSAEVEKMFSSFNGRSRGGDGNTRSLSSGCSSCSASSCAGCKSS